MGRTSLNKAYEWNFCILMAVIMKRENHVGYDAVDSGPNSPNSREILLHLCSVSSSDIGDVLSSEMLMQFYHNRRRHA